MGIVKQVLAEFETESGQQYTIELNESGKIHLHTDQVRIDFTQSEFLKIAETVADGQNALKEIKDGI